MSAIGGRRLQLAVRSLTQRSCVSVVAAMAIRVASRLGLTMSRFALRRSPRAERGRPTGRKFKQTAGDCLRYTGDDNETFFLFFFLFYIFY